jgi:hypothetical protein
MSQAEAESQQDFVIKEINPLLKKIMDRGIPVCKVEFHQAVNNAKDIPVSYLSTNSTQADRRAKMWWINGDGLLCLQKGEYFTVPSSNCIRIKYE